VDPYRDLCLFIVALTFDKSKTWKQRIGRAGFFWIVLLLVTYIGLLHFAILLTSWVPSFVAIVISAIVKLRE